MGAIASQLKKMRQIFLVTEAFDIYTKEILQCKST